MTNWFRRKSTAPEIETRVRALASSTLPDYGYRYFEHVVAEYQTSGSAESSPPGRITEIVTRYQKNQPVTWADLYILEKHILRNQPLNLLRRRAWGLRANFREVVGLRAYEGYISSRPPSEMDRDVTEEAIRADLERLLGTLHWTYSLAPIRERIRSQILWVSLLLLGLSLVVVKMLWHCTEIVSWWPLQCGAGASGKPLVATLLFVAFSGAVGGFVSLQRRIQSIPTDGDPLLSIFELENGKITLLLAPMSGAIFALFLYFAFLGQQLAGGVFPKVVPFDPAKPGGLLLWDLDFGKLLIWSFIAGFAERFVPDTISRLVDRGRDASTPTTTAQQPTRPYGETESSPPNQRAGQGQGGQGQGGQGQGGQGQGGSTTGSGPRAVSSPPFR
jgi:hypothetical protein